MSEYMLDSGHHWMQDCDSCGEWHYSDAPEDRDAETDWTCDACTAKGAEIAALKAEIAKARKVISDVTECLEGRRDMSKALKNLERAGAFDDAAEDVRRYASDGLTLTAASPGDPPDVI